MKSWMAAASLALASAVSAQDQAQPPLPSFRAGVELVRLDVRVVDALGRPIGDLRQSDIEIVEDGQNRPVVFFQHIEEPRESYVEMASRTVAGEVSTNQGAARGHLYVFVFDEQHITAGNEQRARQAAERFLRTRLRPGDRVALYALPGPGPQIAFTPDARRILPELIKVRGMAQAQAVGALGAMTLQEAFQIVRGNDQILQRVADRLQEQSGSDARRGDSSSAIPMTDLVKEDARRLADIADDQTRRVLAMMGDLLRPLRAIEGRKSVLFISEGFYGDRLAREIETVAAAAAESYSVVHAIDVNRRGPDVESNEPTGADPAIAVHDRLSPLGSLSTQTGGTLVVDGGQHADEAFASLADQSQDYYLVGFLPRNDTAKNRDAYRPVTVRVHRAGARVSTRTGFALTSATAGLDRHQTIERAMSAPFPHQGLPVQYTTYILRGTAPGLQRVIVSLSADVPLASGDRPERADVVFVVRAVGDGHVVASGRDLMPLPERHVVGTTTGTGAFHVQFELPAGEYLMRAIVREPGGLVGSADRRFTVRALDGPSLESGDLILSSMRGELPVRPTAYTGDGLSGVLEIYGRRAEQVRDARVTVDLVPIGEAASAASGSADLQDVRAIDGGAAREARLDLPLTGITPGTYLARARVLVGADTVTQVVREIEIRQGQRPVSADDRPPAPFDPRDVVASALARRYAAGLAAAAAPGAPDALRGLDRLGARDYPGAISALQTAMNADGNNGATAFFLGWAFHGAGDDRQAISAWRRAAFVDPSLVPTHLALADAYVRLAQPALAVQALRAGLAALPQAPELLDRLSRLESRR